MRVERGRLQRSVMEMMKVSWESMVGIGVTVPRHPIRWGRRSQMGGGDWLESELTSGIYGGFGINFTEVLEPRFSPFDQPVVAHFMRDTNPLKNDNGKMTKFVTVDT